MAFVRMVKPVRQGRIPSGPTVSIHPNGTMSFNAATVEVFNLDKYSHVYFHYDADRRLIGLVPTNDSLEPGAILIRKYKKTCTFSAVAFLRDLGLIPSKAQAYEVKPGFDTDWIVIDVGGGDAATRG